MIYYKRLTSAEFRDELPRNASGEVPKRALREPYWLGQERRIDQLKVSQ